MGESEGGVQQTETSDMMAVAGQAPKQQPRNIRPAWFGICTFAMDFDESSVKVVTQEFTAVVLAGFGTE